MRIGLVLGGGGGRCLAHIGVVQALEERGFQVDAVAGSSTGAILGALFAAGYPAAEVRRIVKSTNLLGLLSPTVNLAGGLTDQDGVAELLSRHLPETFEELSIPFAAVATDIQKGEMVVLKRGPLARAVCASNAFPGIFEAERLDGRYLIDGGTLNNLPVDIITALTERPTLAVDVSPSASRPLSFSDSDSLLGTVKDAVKGQVVLPTTMLRKAYIISQAFIIDVRLKEHPPAALLRPEFPEDFGIATFNRLDEAVSIGYKATLALLERDGDKLAGDK